MTRSERLLWAALRNKQVLGVGFRRQQVIDRFIVDFFAPSHRLVIEVDGSVHDDREEYDRERERQLVETGLVLIRFAAHEVEQDLAKVLERVKATLQQLGAR